MLFIAIYSQCCLFSLYIAYIAYLASLLPTCAIYVAYRLALFLNSVFRVYIHIN
jgi:hypothetical protein